jgi:hypothetical protein
MSGPWHVGLPELQSKIELLLRAGPEVLDDSNNPQELLCSQHLAN